MNEKITCPWCSVNGKPLKAYQLEFSVLDEDFGQRVPMSMVKFCPFCGREIEVKKK